MQIVEFGTYPTKVGLIVRGMTGPQADPRMLEQHADCVLSNGAPVGFYGEGPPRSGGNTSVVSNTFGVNLNGVVYDYHAMFARRRYYVDLASAKGYGVISTMVTVNVTDNQARLFNGYWRQRLARPGGFDIVGNNCSSRASEAFVVAGIVRAGIPGIDTPVHLYRQLVHVQGPYRTATYSGHIGFVKSASLPGYQVVID
jgi:hypothetical protein